MIRNNPSNVIHITSKVLLLQNRKLALEILKSKEEDPEMRINGFLVYVNDPAPESAEIIKNLLDNEESDQGMRKITSSIIRSIPSIILFFQSVVTSHHS